MAKFIVLDVVESGYPTTTYRINVDTIRLYWPNKEHGKTNISLAGSGASRGSTIIALVETSKLDALVGL